MGGETHRIDLDGDLIYRSPQVTVRVDPATWEVAEAAVTGGDEGEVSLRGAADMYVLLSGLRVSAAHLPGVGPGARITHPGYAD